ncbi:MAG TPA: hypothetical protein VLH84_02850 [Patescibacteria group bacterium]|nr:hypothetical protein [Patescibacteria group bacterium]
MSKPVIAIDIDDTISATTDGVVAHVAKTHGAVLAPGNISDFGYWNSYGISDDESIALVHGYQLAGYPGLAVLPGAQGALQRIARRYRIVLVTSRGKQYLQSTERWINNNFPAIFDDLVFVGNKFVSKKVRSKADVCKEYGAVLLIDDAPHYAQAAAEAGIEAWLFGGYHWHQTREIPGVVRVADWAEVERRLGSDAQG